MRCRVSAQVGVEPPPRSVYSPPMNDTPTPAMVPAEWLEVLAESEADIAAGRVVPGEVVRQMLRGSIARLEAKAAAKQARKATKKGS